MMAINWALTYAVRKGLEWLVKEYFPSEQRLKIARGEKLVDEDIKKIKEALKFKRSMGGV